MKTSNKVVGITQIKKLFAKNKDNIYRLRHQIHQHPELK
jgi:metal-dependent amidase/aminoacylase/carboxypeptidase family protein